MKRLAGLPLLAVCIGCGSGSAEPRVIEDRERGIRYTLPAGWLHFGDELRSPSRSLITLQAHSLEGAERRFVEGLPESMLPQLEGWTKYYYALDGDPARSEATVGGEGAFEITWPVRVRPSDPPTCVSYWLVRQGKLLYVVRAAYAPGAAETDEPTVRAFLSSWTFE